MAASRQPETRKCAPFGVHARPRTQPLCADPDPGSVSSGEFGLCAVQRTPGDSLSTAAGGGPFSRTPQAGLCVLSPQAAPVLPRRIAMRCSRGPEEVIIARVEKVGKRTLMPMNSLPNSWTIIAMNHEGFEAGWKPSSPAYPAARRASSRGRRNVGGLDSSAPLGRREPETGS